MRAADEKRHGVLLIQRLVVLATTAVVVVSLGAPAHATVTVTATSLDQVEERTPIPVVVELENRFDGNDPREPERVVVRLDGGPEKGVGLPCAWETTQSLERRAVCARDDVELDPRTGAPFADGPLRNGAHELTVGMGRGRTETVEVVQSVPGSAVTDLTISVSGQDVALSWTRAPEPDISGYRVQRRSDGGDWTAVTATPGDASGATDRGRSAGEYEYRVLTVRPDGHDGEALVTPSSAGSATVMRPSPSPSSSGDGSPGPGGSGPGESGSAGAGGSSGGSSSDGGRASAPSLRTSPQRGDAGAASGAPSPDLAGTGERFYGEDEKFSAELDFGDAAAAAGEASGAGTDLVRIPGERGAASGLDAERLLPPLAGGLILIALGLHLRQWLTRGSGYLRPG